MKKIPNLIILSVITLLLIIGCTNNNSPNPGNNSQNQILSIYNWSTYINPEILKEFEQKYNIKIKYDTFESNDDLYAKLKPGNPGYDVIFPSDYMVTIMAKEGLLEPLNREKITNIKNIEPKFLNPPFDPGNQYSLPYQWGTMGLGYNIKATGGEINSWQAVFDKKYEGRVALVDELRTMLGGVLIYLGYDPNTTNPEEINKAKDYIIEHRDTIAAFAPDTGQLLLDQGEVDIAVEWSGDIFQVMEENPDIRYTIPKEGSVIWVDTVAIAKNSPHKDTAEQFINFLFEPEISAKVSNFIKYGTPNKVAIEKGLINEKELKNPSLYPPTEVFNKLTYIKDVGEATRIYDEAWTEVKIGVGK
ncbi:extracellular solute-binding protein family 1 [Gloeothece citriformis PCC 7424]|uniref:Extracellular solute-binding protein family 1 n=1 Tax=Gloeothece citriformis (strain PCC 7424) TaxID=65393 RepID=B7K7A1_GLOC7|nr:spermidine/putrescine ABC transporter substrate-binding protein [Gloeothece citriformis]ACK69669.1 extracellular solute-binding protein family 1 [Gloeothece citriformis PCC 7424]